MITSLDKLDWKVEKENKKVENIILQKASTNFGGRKWTAWYNTEIPFQEGPYKFRGLPGLIFEVYDSENIFHYSMVKSQNLSNTYETNDFLETHYGNKPVTITLEQYHKIELDYYNNIIEILNQYREKGVSIASDSELSSKEEIARRRKSLQDNIKNTIYLLKKIRQSLILRDIENLSDSLFFIFKYTFANWALQKHRTMLLNDFLKKFDGKLKLLD